MQPLDVLARYYTNSKISTHSHQRSSKIRRDCSTFRTNLVEIQAGRSTRLRPLPPRPRPQLPHGTVVNLPAAQPTLPYKYPLRPTTPPFNLYGMNWNGGVLNVGSSGQKWPPSPETFSQSTCAYGAAYSRNRSSQSTVGNAALALYIGRRIISPPYRSDRGPRYREGHYLYVLETSCYDQKNTESLVR